MKKSEVKKDIAEAQQVLDEDHYALEKVKDRIVEYLAVQARTNKLKASAASLKERPPANRLGRAGLGANARAASSAAAAGSSDSQKLSAASAQCRRLEARLAEKTELCGAKDAQIAAVLEEGERLSIKQAEQEKRRARKKAEATAAAAAGDAAA